MLEVVKAISFQNEIFSVAFTKGDVELQLAIEQEKIVAEEREALDAAMLNL